MSSIKSFIFYLFLVFIINLVSEKLFYSIRSFVLFFLYSPQKILNLSYEYLSYFPEKLRRKISLLRENNLLKEENLKLKAEIELLKMEFQEYRKFEYVKKVMDIYRNRLIPVEKIDIVDLDREIFIKGRYQKGSLFLGLKGTELYLIGKVEEVFKNKSRVIFLNNSSFRMIAKIKETGEIVLIEGGERIFLNYVSSTSKVKKQHLIVTTSTTGKYPEGIKIGKVKKIRSFYKGLSLKVEITPIYKFNEMDKFFVYKKL